MAEIMSVDGDRIILKGIVPENDALYDGRDPLNLICWQIKSEMIGEHNVCMYYQIARKLNLNGENTIEINFFLSYTGRYEGCECLVDDEQVWKNEYSSRVASLLEAFLIDFNMGQVCTMVRDPERSLRPRREDIKGCPPFPEE